MNINCKKFRLSIYKEHAVTGNPPRSEFKCTKFISGDNGGRQINYAIKILFTTFFLKWRVKQSIGVHD